jgi:hypothetical protein
LHQGRADFGVAEYHQLRRSQLFSHFAGTFTVVDTLKYGHPLFP